MRLAHAPLDCGAQKLVVQNNKKFSTERVVRGEGWYGGVLGITSTAMGKVGKYEYRSRSGVFWRIGTPR